MSPTRRQILKAGVGAGALLGAGLLGRRFVIPPAPSAELAPTAELAARLYAALDDGARAEACFAYDHPLRQYHNRGVDTGGTWSVALNGEARQLVVDLVHAGLSEAGRKRIPNQYFVNVPGIHVTRLAIFGEPGRGDSQVLVTGPHLNLRLGGKNREGVAFGGPQVYGDQRGDGEVGLPGNVYRYQLELGQRLFANLTPAERKQARRPKAPVQTAVEVKGVKGSFDGIPIAELSSANRQGVREIIDGILGTYADEDAAYAWACIETNGGIEALHLADYAEDRQPSRNVGDGPSQIYRIEGPSTVLYYRGEPHLHALFNVAMDGENPLSVGEVVGENPAALDRAAVKRLFEDILRTQTGADAAHYPLESVAGTLRAGTIRTGDLYNLESWREDVTVVEVEGADLGAPIVDAMRARGDSPRPTSRYRIATTPYVADYLEERVLGRIAAREENGAMLRDAAIAHLREHGFPAAS